MECFKSNLSVSNDETNGLTFNNVLLPEEIVLIILSYSDMKTVLKCKLICKKWNELIKSHHFWRLKLNHIKKISKKVHPWYTYYMCYKLFDKNLLKNGNGEDQLEYWLTIGDHWTVETPPQSAVPLPENIPEFNGNKSCFASAYNCTKTQRLEFNNNKVLRKILDEYQPTIYVSDWFSGQLDHYCDYILIVKLHDENDKLLSINPAARQLDPGDEIKWEKVEISCQNYGKGLCKIVFSHGGNYRNKFSGNKMAGGVVKILFDFL